MKKKINMGIIMLLICGIVLPVFGVNTNAEGEVIKVNTNEQVNSKVEVVASLQEDSSNEKIPEEENASTNKEVDFNLEATTEDDFKPETIMEEELNSNGEADTEEEEAYKEQIITNEETNSEGTSSVQVKELVINSDITEWVFDEGRKVLYAICKEVRSFCLLIVKQ